MSRITEQRNNERAAALVAAVHRGAEGLESWTAQCIAATLTTTLRGQIAADLRGMCEANGLPCTSDGGGLPCRCEWAAAGRKERCVMAAAWALLALIAAALVAAIVVGLWLDRPGWRPSGPDAEWLAELGADQVGEEAVERRLRMVDLMRRRVARIGRRPRP